MIPLNFNEFQFLHKNLKSSTLNPKYNCGEKFMYLNSAFNIKYWMQSTFIIKSNYWNKSVFKVFYIPNFSSK